MAVGRYFKGDRKTHGRVDDSYVSEFSDFMAHFLEEHPEEEEEQRRGRLLYWDHRVDLPALAKAQQDSVPDDRYGFDFSVWHRDATPMPKTKK